jgi:hypothetical protein
MLITVVKITEGATTVDIPPKSTLIEAINATHYSLNGNTRSLNGHIVFDSTELHDSDVVVLSPPARET